MVNDERCGGCCNRPVFSYLECGDCAVGYRRENESEILATLPLDAYGRAIGQNPSYRYDTAGITLQGTLIERNVYGPPGYSETPAQDAHETILILKLPQPVSVEPAANIEANGSPTLDPAKNVHEVQLFINRTQAAEARKLLARMVTAAGRLNECITAAQRTKV